MNMLDKISNTIDNINEWIGRVFCFLVVIITLIVVYEVICRHIFGSPTIWSFEITKQIYAAHFLLLTPYALLHGSHVAVDIFHQYLKPRKQAIFNIITYIIFFFPFAIIILWKGTLYAYKSWSIMETSWSVFSAPLYYVKTIIPITAFFLILQGLSLFFRNINKLLRG